MARHRKSRERRGLPRAARGGLAVLVALVLTVAIVPAGGQAGPDAADAGHDRDGLVLSGAADPAEVHRAEHQR
ncbi:hypothetical protein AB0J52_33920, partial [Spirillospora sp. NPDC049652]